MNKKMAVIAAGWHYPGLFYEQMINQKVPAGWDVDYFINSHRDPSFVVDEIKPRLDRLGDSLLEVMDKRFYKHIPTDNELEKMGWSYSFQPNIIGDWGNANQWLERYDYNDYDVLLITHDDNWIVGQNLFTDILGENKEKIYKNIWMEGRPKEPEITNFNKDWLVISNALVNGRAAVRGSFEFFKKNVIEGMGGNFDLDRITHTREGKFDKPDDHMALNDWNNHVYGFMNYAYHSGIYNDHVRFLSDAYRVSEYCIEGERGFLSKMNTPQANIYVSGVQQLIDDGLINEDMLK